MPCSTSPFAEWFASQVPAHTDADFLDKVIIHGENSIEKVMTCRRPAEDFSFPMRT